MSKFKQIVGIDISKNTFDCNVYGEGNTAEFINDTDGFASFEPEVLSRLECKKEEILIAFENTGMYSYNIAVYLEAEGYNYVMLPGLELKRTLGIVRGKSDKIDAKNIARYAYEKREAIRPSKLASSTVIKIKKYLSLRDSLVKSRTGFKANHTESKSVYSKEDFGDYLQILETQINHFDAEVLKVEKIIDNLLQSDESLKTQYSLLTSIKGIGPQIALYLIVYTNGFTKFDSARKFASYIGVAPFPHQSGTSIRGKMKVSQLALKKINALFEMGARSAIQHDAEMKIYYQKKVAEGKEKESVINAVKNKLTSRAFAVIKRGTPYVDIMKFAA